MSNTDRIIEISVDGEGQVYHENNLVSLEQLKARLEMVGQTENLSVSLKPRETVDFGKMLQVMKMVQEAGFANVSMVAGQLR